MGKKPIVKKNSMNTLTNNNGINTAVFPDTKKERNVPLRMFISNEEYNPEFPHTSSVVPYYLKAVGTRQELIAFLGSHPNLSEYDIAYLQRRIDAEKFYEDFGENPKDTVTKAPVIKKDGTLMLNHIHLNDPQYTGNGCYSCSFMLLLQSRGLELTQEQIRSYRPKGEYFDVSAQERMFGDHMGNILDIGGIATKYLKNTAVVEQVYDMDGNGSKEAYAAMKATITEALIKHHSPVSLLSNGHYVTIVGYNEKTDQLIVKNSMNYKNPDKNDTFAYNRNLTLRSLLGLSKVTLNYMMSIDPLKPTENFTDVEGLEFINGNYVSCGEHDFNLPTGKRDIEGLNITKSGLIGNTFLLQSIKIPNKLYPTKEMEENNIPVYTEHIRSIDEDPEKQAILARLNNIIDSAFPKETKIKVIDHGEPNIDFVKVETKEGQEKESPLQFEEVMKYYYFNSIRQRLHCLTPWQTKQVFSEKRLRSFLSRIKGKSLYEEMTQMMKNQPFAVENLGLSNDVVDDPNAEFMRHMVYPPCHLTGGHDPADIAKQPSVPKKKVVNPKEIKLDPSKLGFKNTDVPKKRVVNPKEIKLNLSKLGSKHLAKPVTPSAKPIPPASKPSKYGANKINTKYNQFIPDGMTEEEALRFAMQASNEDDILLQKAIQESLKDSAAQKTAPNDKVSVPKKNISKDNIPKEKVPKESVTEEISIDNKGNMPEKNNAAASDLSLKILLHSLDEYQTKLRKINIKKEKTAAVINGMQNLSTDIADYLTGPISSNPEMAEARFKKMKKDMQKLTALIAMSISSKSKQDKAQSAMNAYMSGCLQTISTYYESISAFSFSSAKSLKDNFMDMRPSVKANLSSDDKHRGAVNVWKPLKYLRSDGSEAKGFFTVNTQDDFSAYQLALQLGVASQAHPPREGRMNKRNEMATLLAGDLGMDYVAKCIPMMLEDSEGNIVEGTFSETVSGTDINHLKPHDPLIDCIYTKSEEESLKAFSHPEFLKQLCDTQVFDYLMFNVDRSRANMFYKVSKDDNGKSYVSGISLIDNDSSYYAEKADKCSGFMVCPEQMRAISSSMADRILNLDTEKYVADMASKDINAEQIKFALQRLNIMKKHITDAIINPKQGVFKILSDDDFKNLSIKDFKDPAKFPHSKIGLPDFGSTKDLTVFDRVYELATKQVSLFKDKEAESKYMETYNQPEVPGTASGINYAQGVMTNERPKLTIKALTEYKVAINTIYAEFDEFEFNSAELSEEVKNVSNIVPEFFKNCNSAINHAIRNANEGTLHEEDLTKINDSIAALNTQVLSVLTENSKTNPPAEDNIFLDKLMKKTLSLPVNAENIAVDFETGGLELGVKMKNIAYHAQSLKNLKKIRREFKNQEGMFVSSDDPYKKLQKNIKAYIAYADKVMASEQPEPDALKKMDLLLNEVNHSADNYIKTKIVKEAKKRTDRGQERLKIAKDLKQKNIEAKAEDPNINEPQNLLK